MEKLQLDDLGMRRDATALLGGEIVSNRALVLPLVLAGAVETLIANEALSARDPSELRELRRFSMMALALLADSHCGAERIVRSGAVGRWVGELPSCKSPIYLSSALRLLEVLSQRPFAAAHLASHGALDAFVGVLKAHLEKRGVCGVVCPPALGALKYLIASHPTVHAGPSLAALQHLQPADPKVAAKFEQVLRMAAARPSFDAAAAPAREGAVLVLPPPPSGTPSPRASCYGVGDASSDTSSIRETQLYASTI